MSEGVVESASGGGRSFVHRSSAFADQCRSAPHRRRPSPSGIAQLNSIGRIRGLFRGEAGGPGHAASLGPHSVLNQYDGSFPFQI